MLAENTRREEHWTTSLESKEVYLTLTKHVRFSLTLVDSLDTLLVGSPLYFTHHQVFNDTKQFEDSVKKVISHVSFAKPVTVSIFECTIR